MPVIPTLDEAQQMAVAAMEMIVVMATADLTAGAVAISKTYFMEL